MVVDCDWGSRTSGSQATSSQRELDSLAENCTTVINSDIVVDSNYTGSLILSGITQITGSFSIGSNDQDSQLTSIEMPDLVAFYAAKFLSIHRGSKLTAVTFPKLRAMYGSGVEIDGAPNVQLNFPSLLNVTNIEVYRGLSRYSAITCVLVVPLT
tara:strand:- start:566 stop:1030 length:465 start_codon:yes stop_codon:yes gene_type:complete